VAGPYLVEPDVGVARRRQVLLIRGDLQLVHRRAESPACARGGSYNGQSYGHEASQSAMKRGCSDARRH
jgi:hypothetical protein